MEVQQEAQTLTRVDSPLPFAVMGEYVDEQYLTEEIQNTWENRQSYARAINAQKAEVKAKDARLGEMLYTMKTVLSKPGRAGGWSSWLRERGIPRATADRLVSDAAKKLGIELPHEAIQRPVDEAVQELFKSVYPRLRKVLTSAEAVDLFVMKVRNALMPVPDDQKTSPYPPEQCDFPPLVRDEGFEEQEEVVGDVL